MRSGSDFFWSASRSTASQLQCAILVSARQWGLFSPAVKYRGRGLAQRVTAALAIRAPGRVPLYSISWTNHHASLAVARKLGLVAYTSTWSIY